MSRFTAIDLSQMPPPDIIKTLSFEDTLDELKTDFKARWAVARESDPTLPPYDVEMLESDPAIKLMEVCAYRDMLKTAEVNDAARALLVAKAVNHDLEHLAAWYGVERLPGEDDDRFRRRVQLAPEAFSGAGPEGAYLFHILTLSLDIEDAALTRPQPGMIHAHVLLREGADEGLYAEILARLKEDDIAPFTDAEMIAVLAARKTTLMLDVELEIGRGPDLAVIETAALAAIEAYLLSRRKIGKRVTVSGLSAAAHVGGVEKVVLSLDNDLDPGSDGVVIAGSINIATQVI